LTTPSLLQRLSAHRTIGAVPEGEIAWVAAHGVLRQLDSGIVLTSKDGQVEGLHIVLAGHLTIHVDRGAGRRKIMEWHGGDVTGLMPYSRLVAPPGNVIAEEPTEVLTVGRKDIPEMIRECQELTAILVHVMLDRARHFTSSYLHDEKLVSLGKLAAGLAHELNNPAAAIVRSAGAISSSVTKADAASRALGSLRLKHEDNAAIDRVRQRCLAGVGQPVLSPLEQEDRENAIARWLDGHGVDGAAAEALAETNITVEMMEQLAASMNREALTAALQWIAADCATNRLTSEIQEASLRISDLVAAIKGFTEMDRSSVPEPVDIARGLANTMTVLRAKAKGKSAGMSMNVEDALPAVNGFGGELNQVWANLVDNALDAAGEGGRVELKANRERGAVIVRVIDNGPGIPPEIRDRIFDPFFTTKPVGQGTGLGLDIVRRLLQRHSGQIEVDSSPGRTEFRVILPAAEGSAGSAQ
jgi:signal transduction histidine kinase